MEKSIIIYQLVFPPDILDYICSFAFYTITQSIEKNKKKYNRILCDIKKIQLTTNVSTPRPRRFIVTKYIVLPITKQLIIANICHICGNYVKHKKHNFACKCLF